MISNTPANVKIDARISKIVIDSLRTKYAIKLAHIGIVKCIVLARYKGMNLMAAE